MQEAMKKFIMELKSDRKRRRRLGRRVFALSLLVAASVAWQLRITGITMSDVPCCGMEEHVHGPECIEMVLFCGMEEEEWEEAFPTDPPQPELICQLPEHTHGEACTLVETELICTESHEHGDECYEITQIPICEEDHEHEEGCFEEQRTLICEWEHIHDDSCYQITETFVCTEQEHIHGPDCYEIPELPPQETGHHHSDDCYMSSLVCGYEEEHEHSVECYSNPDADLESPGDWESTLPGLIGKRDHDLAAVARSQVGYRESDDNFEVHGDDRRGITRYGQWYGNPYGEWNAMFVTFCLRYAGIDDIPGNSGAYAWTAELNQWGLLRSPSYTPVPGDLVFFDWEGDGAADHVGIVTKVNGHAFKTIEGGRNDCVDTYEYGFGDGSVYGFVRITDKEEKPEPTEAPTTEPITEPTEETTIPTEETSEPTDPTEETSEPTDPTEETTTPTDPTEETTEPTEETTEPTEETTEPTEETTVPTEPEPQTIPVAVYEDENCETAVEGAVPMTVSGIFPEGVSVRAYPVEWELPGREILFAFHIGLYDAENHLIDLGDATLSMTLPQLLNLEENGDMVICRIHPDMLEEPVEASMEGENLTFDLANDAVYALVRPVAEEEPEQTQLTVAVYEDAACTIPAEGAVPMTVSGVFPEGCTARAYPVETVLEGKNVLMSFHIGVYDAEGNLLEAGEEPMTLAMALPQFLNLESDVTLYRIHSETPEEKVESAVTGGELLFPLTNDAVYALTQPAEMVLPVTVYEDEACTVPMEGAPAMTITGILPEGCTARAYPVALTLPDWEIHWAFHIGVYLEDGTPVVPQKPLAVSIAQPQLFAEEEQQILYVPADGEPQTLSANQEGENLTFQAPGPGTYAAGVENLTAESALRAAARDGGTYTLTEDMTVSGDSIPVSGNFTLELNGFTLTAATNGPLFTVADGGSMTIQDNAGVESGQGNGETVMRNRYPEGYGKTASLDGKTLTYYVTLSSGGSTTSETLVQHTVTCQGGITAANGQPLIQMSGGSLTLNSGMLYGGSNRAIEMSGGTANLEGGYICGFTQASADAKGGAMSVTGGTLNIPGTVIAANTASQGGGIYANGGEINMSGGIISGNTATGIHGGGIYADGTAISMTGGYLTNNLQMDGGAYDNGGGGLLLTGKGSFTMNGGCITGNKSGGGGGGTKFMGGSRFTMHSGNVCANVAEFAEAGGINVDAGSSADIISGHINNNFNSASPHWGGGGLFVADAAVLNIHNVVITDNAAGGLGGGVAVCSTGNVHVFGTNGSAIFANRDMESIRSEPLGKPNWVQAGIKAGIDMELANNQTFLENGHEDLFSALYFYLTGHMLGGGAENWQGTVDGVVTEIGQEEFVQSMRALGMQAHPTEEDQTAAWGSASVYITGNYSSTHGGGILCNGSLNIGTPAPTYSNAFFSLSADKSLLGTDGKPPVDENGVAVSIPAYTFELLNDKMEVLETVTCHPSGMILFTSKFEYNEAREYVYYVREVPPTPAEEGMIYDTALRRITVTVAATDQPVPRSAEPVQQYTYIIETVKVEKQKSEEEWVEVQFIDTANGGIWDFNDPDNGDRTNYRLHLGGDHTKFVNRKFEPKPCGFSIVANKLYRNPTGAIPIEEGKFSFQLLDHDQTTVLGTVFCGTDGKFDFSEVLKNYVFNEARDYYFYVKEVPGPEEDGIRYDPAVYQLIVKVSQKTEMSGPNNFFLDSITVNKDGTQLQLIDLVDQWSQYHEVDLSVGNQGQIDGTKYAFINYKLEAKLRFNAKKKYLDQNGQQISQFEKAFSLDIFDEQNNLIGNAPLDKATMQFKGEVLFTKEGNRTIYVCEHIPNEVDEVKYDPIKYRLELKIEKQESNGVPSLVISEMKVFNDGTNTLLHTFSSGLGEEVNIPDNTYDTAFTNEQQSSTSITVKKVWDGAAPRDVTIWLVRNGVKNKYVVLKAGGSLEHTWEDLPFKDESGNPYSYTIEEQVPEDCVALYSYAGEAGKPVSALVPVDADKVSYGNSYYIVSGDYALCLPETGGSNSVSLTRGSGKLTIDGKEITEWYVPDDIPTACQFAFTQDYYPFAGKYHVIGSSKSLGLTSDKQGVTLGETGSHSGVVYDGSGLRLTYHSQSEGNGWPPPDGFGTRMVNMICDGSGYFAVSETSSSTVKLYEEVISAPSGGVTVTITNSPKPESPEYNLPETGGLGTNGFTLLGAALMAAAGGLWIIKRNRKGGKSA